MDAATQSEEEYNELILIWLEEYNKQRDDLNLNVRSATERHILEVAIEMELKLNGQLPTNNNNKFKLESCLFRAISTRVDPQWYIVLSK